MARVKRGVTAHKRHKRLLKAAEGRRGTPVFVSGAGGGSAVASAGITSGACLRSGASWLLGLWSDAIVMCIDLPSSSGVRSATP